MSFLKEPGRKRTPPRPLVPSPSPSLPGPVRAAGAQRQLRREEQDGAPGGRAQDREGQAGLAQVQAILAVAAAVCRGRPVHPVVRGVLGEDALHQTAAYEVAVACGWLLGRNERWNGTSSTTVTGCG